MVASADPLAEALDHLDADIVGLGPEAALAHSDRRWQREGQRTAFVCPGSGHQAMSVQPADTARKIARSSDRDC